MSLVSRVDSRVDLSVDEFDQYSLCIEDSPMDLQPKVLDMDLNEVTLEWEIALISPAYIYKDNFKNGAIWCILENILLKFYVLSRDLHFSRCILLLLLIVFHIRAC